MAKDNQIIKKGKLTLERLTVFNSDNSEKLINPKQTAGSTDLNQKSDNCAPDCYPTDMCNPDECMPSACYPWHCDPDRDCYPNGDSNENTPNKP